MATSSSSTEPSASSLKRGVDRGDIPEALQQAMTGFEQMEPHLVWELLNRALHRNFATDMEDTDRIEIGSYTAGETEEILLFLNDESLHDSMEAGDVEMLRETWVAKIILLVEKATGTAPSTARVDTKQRRKGKGKQAAEPLPLVLRCSLQVRVGTPKTTLRSNPLLKVPPWNFTSEDSFETLLSQIRSKLRSFTGYIWPEDATVYFAPLLTTKQTELVELTEDNFQGQFEYSYNVANTRRKAATEGFVISLFAYLQSKQPAAAVGQSQIRRATTGRINTATNHIETRLRDPDMADLRKNLGPVAKRHWATTAARQMNFDTQGPEAFHPPQTNTFRQCLHVDGQLREINRRQEAAVAVAREEYKTIRILWGDNTVLPLSVNVADLRSALGIPDMNLMGLGIFDEGNTAATAGPAVDMPDVDHVSSGDEEEEGESLTDKRRRR